MALVGVVVFGWGCGPPKESCWDVPLPVGGSAIAIERVGGESIAGRVLTVRGTPIREAWVTVDNVGKSTDENGRFSIEGFRDGTSELRVRAIGYVMARRSVTLERDRGLTVLAVLEAQPVALTDQCGFPMGPVAKKKPWWKFW